jgi:hypothetical protein
VQLLFVGADDEGRAGLEVRVEGDAHLAEGPREGLAARAGIKELCDGTAFGQVEAIPFRFQ